METRIKYIKKNNAWYYAVQAKKWIFWNTLKLCSTWLAVEEFFNEMEKVDGYYGDADFADTFRKAMEE